MSGYFFYKLVLFLLFIPVVAGLTYFGKNFLNAKNPIRLFVERHGIYKVAQFLLSVSLVVIGTGLTFFYN